MDRQACPRPVFKNPYLYSAIVFAAAVIYVSFLLLSRYQSTRAYEHHNAEKAAQERREEDQAVIEQLGGSEVAIRTFYISPGTIRRGENAQLCYDVDNAKTVTLDPPAAEVWPSHNRCFAVSPTNTTTYTLSITGASGKSASQSLELRVH